MNKIDLDKFKPHPAQKRFFETPARSIFYPVGLRVRRNCSLTVIKHTIDTLRRILEAENE